MPATTPEERARRDRRLKDLARRGHGRNEIAKRLGVSVGTITKDAGRLGVSFDRSATAAAVEARVVDLKARRKAILDRLYTRIERNLDRLEGDGYTHSVILGSEMGDEYREVTDKQPPSADERAHMAVITGYLASAVKLEQVDADGGESEAKSMLLALGEALGIESGA